MPNQLIDPFDREVRRISRPQRNDGFSNDGLSYRVADDFGKLWGQAMAEYDARTEKPRNDVWGQTLQEDTPDALRHELFDPLTQRFGSDRQTHTRTAPLPRTYKVGNDVFSIDPRTGATAKILDTPDKPDNRGDSFERSVILGKINTLRQLQANPMNMRLSGKTPEQIDADIAALEDQGRQIYQKATPTAIAPSVPESRTPQIFMGDPLAAPQTVEQAPAEPPTITSKAQFDALPSGAVYVSKNGKRHRKP